MAEQFEQLNSRRRRRRQLQKQRQAQRQRKRRLAMLTALAVAAVSLLVGIVLLVRGCQPETPGASSGIPSGGVSVPPTTHPQAPETVITITAAGDLNITDRVVAAGEQNGRYNYTGAFLDVAGLFAQSTASVLNLEGNLRGAPYGTERASAPRELAAALADMGVDLVQLANSYTIHNGLDGLNQTVNTLRAHGLEPLGAYASIQEARQSKGVTVLDIGGVRVAFVAFTKGVGSLGLPAGSESQVNLLYKDYSSTYQTVDTEGIRQVLDAARAQKPDLTIALLHWGSEYNDEISDTQDDIVKLMLENGVDAILGTHPHYVQKVVFDQEQGTLVAYSLGDFFGDGDKPGTNYSVVLQLQITRDNRTGQTKITGWDYVPVFLVNQEDQPLRVVRIREAMTMYENNHIDKVSKAIYDEMAYALKRIEARIKGE